MCSINQQVIAAAPRNTLLVCTDVTGEQVASDDLAKSLTREGVDAIAPQDEIDKSPHSLAASSILRMDTSATWYDPVAAACLLSASDICASTRRVHVSVDPETGKLCEDPCGREVDFLSCVDHAEYHRLLAELLEPQRPSPNRRGDVT